MKDTEQSTERRANMRTTRLLTVLIGMAAIATLTADASAYYHPTMGRFSQRDPGAGAKSPARVGAAGPAAGGRFAQRDPTGTSQYADGMNLYQYVGSRPTAALDPMGTKCCLKSVHFRYTDDPKLSRWVNPKAGSPSSFLVPNGQFRAYLWRLQQRIEITAFVTAGSDPRDCVMRQKTRTLSYEVKTKGTPVPSIKKRGEVEYQPDWPIKDGKPQVNTDWSLVKYGPDWVMWWDEPGVQLLSEVDLTKVQQYDLFVWQDFETTIYDKSADRAARWRGDWATIIGGELHITGTKAVKENYWGLTALFESKSYQTPPAPTRKTLIQR